MEIQFIQASRKYGILKNRIVNLSDIMGKPSERMAFFV